MVTRNGIALIRKSLVVLLALALLPATAGPALAHENKAAPGAAPSRAPGVTDPAELGAFLDQLLAQEMAEYHIAGTAVSVVKDGRLFYAKGYGYADVDHKAPLDAEHTVLKIGSVGKMFTWTAVMQLVEQGKLDLDADVNTYLDFRIPDTYPQPITLRHLLTHTPGFEDSYYEFNALTAHDLVPVGEWLASHIPARVRPPGDSAAYSNYGAALAGYIVARVSGQPYDQYLQDHFFRPLGMVHTTAQEPVPPDLSAQLSVGYIYKDGVFRPFPDYMNQLATVPTGWHLSSATDVARFMIAHLQRGRYSDDSIAEARILKESTARQMHETQYAPHPRILGTTFGFFDFSDNGQRTIGLGGESYPFNTLLFLVPDQNLGVFVAYNSEGGGNLNSQHVGFQRAFFDHYFPAAAIQSIQAPANFAAVAGRFEGTYLVNRRAYTTLEKFNTLLRPTFAVRNPGDGTLVLGTPYGEVRLVQVEPLYFRQVDGSFGVAFREDDQGRITHMFIDFAPQYALEKLAWYESPGLHLALLMGCVLVFLSLLAVVLIRAILNRRPGVDRRLGPRGARLADGLLVGICVLNLVFVAGTYLSGNLEPRFGVTPFFTIVLGLGVLSAGLTVGALVYMVQAWQKRSGGTVARAYLSLVTVAAVAFVWFLNYWNLLGWRF